MPSSSSRGTCPEFSNWTSGPSDLLPGQDGARAPCSLHAQESGRSWLAGSGDAVLCLAPNQASPTTASQTDCGPASAGLPPQLFLPGSRPGSVLLSHPDGSGLSGRSSPGQAAVCLTRRRAPQTRLIGRAHEVCAEAAVEVPACLSPWPAMGAFSRWF